MSRAALESYGMIPIGRIELPDERTFLIRLEHGDAGRWKKAVYAFLVGDEIRRIGSSKGLLAARMKSWNRDVTNSLRGLKSPTPQWEAEGWRNCLTTHGSGEVFARLATRVTTPVGTFEAYMDEESVLINRHKPPLNRHTNR
jgi:hypothetical protein